MNPQKPLLAGFVIGLFLAIAPSCGTVGNCNASNCSTGCCDSKGTCQSGSSNGACGQLGASCNTCMLGTACNLGTCMLTGFGGGTGGSQGGGTGGSQGGGTGGAQGGGTGGAQGGGTGGAQGGGTGGAQGGGTGGAQGGGTGGGGGCAGCIANGTTCISLANSGTNSFCGRNGVTCATCSGGQTCSNYQCVGGTGGGTGGGGGVTGGGTGGGGVTTGIGSPCTVDNDCNTVALTSTDTQYGVRAYCKLNAIDLNSQTGMGVAFPQGYCSKRCGFDSTSCGTGAQCLISLGFIGHAENLCYRSCTASTDCRSGYDCVQLTTAISICLPTATAEVDAGPGFAGTAGAACSSDFSCQPPASGSCITQVGADGGQTGFTGGMCTAECGAVAALQTGDAWCGTGGACNPYAYNVGDNLGPLVLWQCDKGCTSNTDCRSGYVCDTGGNACVPNCNNKVGFCGTGTCLSTGLCQ